MIYNYIRRRIYIFETEEYDLKKENIYNGDYLYINKDEKFLFYQENSPKHVINIKKKKVKYLYKDDYINPDDYVIQYE